MEPIEIGWKPISSMAINLPLEIVEDEGFYLPPIDCTFSVQEDFVIQEPSPEELERIKKKFAAMYTGPGYGLPIRLTEGVDYVLHPIQEPIIVSHQ